MEVTVGNLRSNRNNRFNLKAGLYSALITQIALFPAAFAGPVGGNVVGGVGAINQSGLTTTINQSTGRLAIDWQSFDINQNETVNFHQPDTSSIALNRILGQDASQIHGSINANGQVILVNPNGVFFSESATVNVGGLFASALDISPEDFMQGHLDFTALENTTGLIVNEGTLQVVDGGTLALMGQQVKNKGLLIANFGVVALAAGSDISVQFEDQAYTSITINANTLAGVLGIDEPAIFNSGIIQAHGGRVVLSARQAQAIKESVANFDSSEAFSFDQGQIVEKDGVVYLTGPDGNIADLGVVDVSTETGNAGEVLYAGNNIDHSGQINADSEYGNGGQITIDATDTVLLKADSTVTARSHVQGEGGRVHALGKNIGMIETASIDVSGANGGGEVLVGGDYQGKNPDIKNADAVYLGEATNISANATENGDGGKIIVWSDKASRVYGELQAKGGEQSGDGGFIETSSHEYIDLAPKVDVHAVNGEHGTWLIDPSNINIFNQTSTGITASTNGGGELVLSTPPSATTSTLNINDLENALGNGANVIIQTADNADATSGGNITLSTNLDLDQVTDNVGNLTNGTYSLSLIAHNNININRSILETGGDDVLNLTLNAGGAITLASGQTVNTAGGSFNASGTSFTSAGATINTSNSVLNNNGNISITATAGNVVLGNIATDIVTAGVTNGDLTVTASGSISDNTVTALRVNGNTILDAGNASNIVFDNVNNDFIGVVSVIDGATVTIRDANDLTLGNVSSVSTLDARAANELFQAAGSSINSTIRATLFSSGGALALGNIDVSDSLTVSALNDVTVQPGAVVSAVNFSDLTSTAGSITLLGTNNFGNIVRLNSSGATTIESGGTLNLGSSDIGTDLTITASGAVSDETGEDVIVGGLTTINISENSSVILDSAGNDFTDDIFVVANTLSDFTVVDTSAFTLQTGINVTGDINLRAASLLLNTFSIGSTSTLKLTSTGGDIDQLAAMSHTGNTVLSADGAINFTEINSLSNIQIDNSVDAFITTSANINNQGNSGVTTILGVNGVVDLQLLAGGDIQESGAIEVSDLADFNVGNHDLLLDTSIHDFNNFNAIARNINIREADSINLSGNMETLNVTASESVAGSTVSNIQDSQIVVTGETRIDVGTGGNVNLANFTGGLRNNLTGDIFINESGQSTTNVSIRNAANIQLAATLRVDDILTLDTDADIVQASGASIIAGDAVGENANLTATNIILDESNNFIGVNVTGSASTMIRDVDQMVFESSGNGSVELTVGGALELNGDMASLTVNSSAGDISSGITTLSVTGDTVINTFGADVYFDTNNVNLNNLTLNNVTSAFINEVDSINLSGTMQNLTVALAGVAGSIGNGPAGLSVTGVTTLDANDGDIVLDNNTNDFVDFNVANVRDLTVHDANDLTLKDIQSHDLNVTTHGLLLQQGGTVLESTGNSVLDASSGTVFLSGSNQFTNLELYGASSFVSNAQSLQLSGDVDSSVSVVVTNGDITLGSLASGSTVYLSADGSIFDGNGVADNIVSSFISLSAANGIGMGGADSDIDIRASSLNASNSTSGDINIKNISDSITLNSIINNADNSGDFNFESTRDIYVNSIVLRKDLVENFFPDGTGRVNMRTAEGSFYAIGDVLVPDITATNLRLIGLLGTLGTLQRSFLLDISGKVELLMRASLAPQFVFPEPDAADIQDNSLLRFTTADTLSAANGVQVTEVETLLDIDPAIFTELQHFLVDTDPVLLPLDQRFDVEDEDDDEEYFKRISGETTSMLN